ncbi:hypothetical protein CFP65_3085 [Kitasatospora sp. MMS16-BH015]|uniref:TauD/TfdA family dioxygenase n=1 Tax=Kitasatospora sp. MMS16-BH015 TaxID=2018025 RepID=UPI000CA25FB4|nr:TauD/TfdA family dioxygenase [Kitasatospora sp. MMS16-BH015]AUG77892.1 hypothetical protein CFP65_3085 [Kitasatospora sp. MMS16-BH015]
MFGTFTPRPDHPHPGLRTRLLESGHELAEPAAHPAPAGLSRLVPWVREQVRDTGLALARLDEPLDAAEFLALGTELGEIGEETDPAVRPYVERGRILNLVSEQARTEDISLQPFSTGPLTLHSEGSGRPLTAQPRYIVLMCRDPGDDGTAARTVLVPMDTVASRLSPHHLRALHGTSYRDAPGVPPVARALGDRTAFSFRDFDRQPLHWRTTGQAPSGPDPAQAVNGAIAALLAAMYQPEAALGVRWRRGTLAVIDNTRFFHGRTAGRFGAGARRHLQRLRVTAR